MASPVTPLNALLQKTGQFPQIVLKMVPLETTRFANAQYGVDVTTFIDYRFRASVVSPIAEFSFTFAYPSQTTAFSTYIKEGDIILLYMALQGQEYTLSTGIIDTIETQVTPTGETVTVMGRDLLGQWEDQGVFTPDGQGIFAAQMTPTQIFTSLQTHTRTQKFRSQNMPTSAAYVGMNPMESKLQVLSRFLEPFNALVWCDPDGGLVFGKPNMAQQPSGTVIMNKGLGIANCVSMRSTRSSATIPNFVIPILSTQTLVANQVAKRQGLANPQPGPKRLASLGHYLHRVFTISDPDGNTAQSLNAVQSLSLTGSPLDKCRAYGIRELARENMKELLIQAVVPGHVNETGQPYRIDQTYRISFDRDGVDEQMYLYEIEYTLDEKEGPRSLLMFTRLNTIVAGSNFQ